MFELLITMAERLGIIVTIAFLLTRLPFFRNMVHREQFDRRQQLTAMLFFGFFGIIGTYAGVTLSAANLQFDRWATELSHDEAIANFRVIGAVLGGLLGGYRVGIGAGIIAGVHRFTLGGFTAVSCGLATMVAGIISGMNRKPATRKSAFLIGAFAEAVQMLVILLLASPFEQARTLVEIIGVPMILSNGIGCVLFLIIIQSVINEEEKIRAMQAQKTLNIANQTLSYLRSGLNPDAAKAVCQIIHRQMKTTAVAITDVTEVLSHVGAGSDDYKLGDPIQSPETLDTIRTGNILVSTQDVNCPLGAKVIAPLKQHGQTIGTLTFYFQTEKEITNVIMELISGLSSLMSNQLEFAYAERAHQLAKEAEIKALQAQINPHFLFNTLSLIVSMIRIDPEKARKLMVSLSHFLRQNLTVTTSSTTTLEQEMKHVKAYLEIEKARHVHKLEVIYDIDERTLSRRLPPLTLQPLVENAMKHGFKNKVNECLIKITLQAKNNATHITVEDNGQGMSQERIANIGSTLLESGDGSGLALYNVNRRLIMMFGEMARLQIESEPDQGTAISFTIPHTEGNEVNWNRQSEH